MARSASFVLGACAAIVAACSLGDGTGLTGTNAGLLVINANLTPVDILVDENVASAAVDPGHVAFLTLSTGTHILALRQTGTAPMVATTFTTSARYQRAFAAVRTVGGTLAAAAIDDTGSVVPAGATKLRVLHLAPNAGELQVYRTQPDFPTPVRWQFPFTYQAQPTSATAPYYQSTVGTWEVRVWPAADSGGSTGWASASVKVSVPLASGQKKTVLILDQPGGGVRVQVID